MKTPPVRTVELSDFIVFVKTPQLMLNCFIKDVSSIYFLQTDGVIKTTAKNI